MRVVECNYGMGDQIASRGVIQEEFEKGKRITMGGKSRGEVRGEN